MAKYNLAADEARSKVERVNRARANYYFRYIGHQWNDSHGYDLIINTADMSYDSAARLIEETVKEKYTDL